VADGAHAEMRSLLRQSTESAAGRVGDQLAVHERFALLLAQNPDVRERAPDRQRLTEALNGSLSATDNSIVSSALIDAIGRVYVQVVKGSPVDPGMRRRHFAFLQGSHDRASPTTPSKHAGGWWRPRP
jgi:hypothetical protein